MSRDRAAYMREYRARRRAIDFIESRIVRGRIAEATSDIVKADTRIIELEAEVARLKRELAARPAGPAFNSRPFTPVPKKG